MAVLLGPKDVARAADLQIAHGDAEARAELRELADGLQPLLGGLGEHLVRADGEVGVGLAVAAAHTTPQLVQLAQAEAIRVKDDQRVGGGHVQAALDDGGAKQHVVAAGVEVHHHVLQAVLLHLPVGHADAGLRHQRPEPVVELLDGVYPVVEEVHLTAPGQLAQNRVADQRVGVVHHMGLHRQTLLRRGLQHAHVPDAHHGHVQRPGDGCGGEGQHVHLALHVLDDFLVPHAEALLLVHNQQPQILELHVLGQQAVGAHDDVDVPGLQFAQDRLGLLGRAEAAEHLRLHREALEALEHRVVVLLGQDGGGGQDGHLLVVHHSLEGRTEAHLCLAVAHVAAQEAIHVVVGLHVPGDFLHGLLLIGGQLIGEAILELPLPGGVRVKGVALALAALGVEGHQVEGQLPQSLLDLALLLLPVAPAQTVQLRGLVGVADVALHPLQLVDGHVELVGALVLDQQIIPVRALTLQMHGALVHAHAVILMHHVVAHLQVGEGGDLLARGAAGAGLAVSCAVDVRVRHHRQLRLRPEEAVAQRAGQHHRLADDQVVGVLHEGGGGVQLRQGLGQTLATGHAAGEQRHAPALLAPGAAVLRQQLQLGLVPRHALAAQVDGVLGFHAALPAQKLRQGHDGRTFHGGQQLAPVHQQGLLGRDRLAPLHGGGQILPEAPLALVRTIPQLIRRAQEHHVRPEPVQHRGGMVGQHGQPGPDPAEGQAVLHRVRVPQEGRRPAFQLRSPGRVRSLLPGLGGDLLVKDLRQFLVILGQGRQIVKEPVGDVLLRGGGVHSLPHAPGGFGTLAFRQQHLRRRGNQRHLHPLQAPLADAVESADGVHLVVEELNAQALRRRRGIHVQDGAAQGALPLALHHVHPLVAHEGQGADELLRRIAVGHHQADSGGPEGVRVAHALQCSVHGGDQQPRVPGGDAGEGLQPPPGAFMAGRATGQVDLPAGEACRLIGKQLLGVVGQAGGLQVVGGDEQRALARVRHNPGRNKSRHALGQPGHGGGASLKDILFQLLQGGRPGGAQQCLIHGTPFISQGDYLPLYCCMAWSMPFFSQSSTQSAARVKASRMASCSSRNW